MDPSCRITGCNRAYDPTRTGCKPVYAEKAIHRVGGGDVDRARRRVSCRRPSCGAWRPGRCRTRLERPRRVHADGCRRRARVPCVACPLRSAYASIPAARVSSTLDLAVVLLAVDPLRRSPSPPCGCGTTMRNSSRPCLPFHTAYFPPSAHRHAHLADVLGDLVTGHRARDRRSISVAAVTAAGEPPTAVASVRRAPRAWPRRSCSVRSSRSIGSTPASARRRRSGAAPQVIPARPTSAAPGRASRSGARPLDRRTAAVELTIDSSHEPHEPVANAARIADNTQYVAGASARSRAASDRRRDDEHRRPLPMNDVGRLAGSIEVQIPCDLVRCSSIHRTM